ncbi:MAG: protein kinase, partial [Acidobacteriota bacterium]
MIPKEPGGLLSHYRLVEKIGEGGMGVVWKAVDTVLGRSVAIKFLPEALAQHPERRARLEREAKLLASLNHPNIASIYGLEEADGVLFLVMEFVPGETLEQLLEKGSLTGEEPLYFSRQIAGALETAHDRGVIHRDLKPANVKVTPEGMVKVLDFGLAKAFETEAGSGDISRSPTITTGGTRDGVILGTAAYMSPEQARGKPVDRRTDIWSFGCVLFEMITGARPFQGETLSDTSAAILKPDPDWSSVPITTSAGIESLVRKCLRKDSYQRLQHIGDARVEIDDLLEGRSATRPIPAAVSSVPPRRYPLWGLGLAAMVLVLLGALLGRLIFPTSGIPPERNPKVSHLARLTHDTGLSEGPTWSPDGRLLAFASNRSGNFEVYVRRVEGGQDINITNDPGQDFQPAFSPDGNRVAFISTRSSRSRMIKIAGLGLEFRTFGGDLWVAPALGGQARRLARDANFPAGDPGGRKIIYARGPEYHRSILEVAADGTGSRTILFSDASNWEIVRLRYSPGGKWISVEDSVDGEIFLIPSSGGEPRKLVEGSSHEWDPSGRYLYFLKREKLGGTRLHSVRVSELSGKVVENPNTVTLMTGLLRDLAISRDGKSLAVSELNGSRNLTLLPLDEEGKAPGGPEEILNRGQIIDTIPAFSPDGRRISFNSNRLGVNDLWILDLDTRRQKRLELPGDYQDTGW